MREIVEGFAKVEENRANLTAKEHDPYSTNGRSPRYLALPSHKQFFAFRNICVTTVGGHRYNVLGIS